MNNQIVSLVSDPDNSISLDDDFVIIRNPDLSPIKGEVIKSESSVILSCTRGHLDVTVDMNNLSITEGQVVYILEGQLFQIKEISDDLSASVLVISSRFLSWLDLKQYFIAKSLSGHAIYSQSHSSFEKYLSICKDIILFDENPEKKDVVLLLTKAYVIGLSHFSKVLVNDNQIKNASVAIMKKFLSLLNSEGSHHRFLKYYSDALCISEKYLSYVSRQCSGHSALYWINQAVTKEAKRLLSASHHPIAYIAEQLEFPTQSGFARYFRQQTGMTPQEYRRQNPEL